MTCYGGIMRILLWIVLFVLSQFNLQAEQEPKTPYLYCRKKWKEIKWEGMRIQVLKLRAEQFPPGKDYTLFIRNFDGSETQIFNYTANEKGHLIVQMSYDLKKGVPFAVTPLRKGEKVSYCMYSPDRKEKFMTSIVPFPIENAMNGLSVSVELVDTLGKEFVCVGKGFSKNEPLKIICKSQGETIQQAIHAKEDGRFSYAFEPQTKGAESGKAVIIVKRANEEIKVPFVWGRQSQEFVGAICLQIQ